MKISNKMQSKNGLNIIIVGCGKVGMTLIEQLSKEGHDITIIDKNAAKVQEMSNLYDIMGLVGNGSLRKNQVCAAALQYVRRILFSTPSTYPGILHGSGPPY